MASENDIHAVVARWRRNVKGKFRGIASFDERAELRFNAIKDRIYRKRVKVDDWLYRRAYYRGWNRYEFLDADWKPIRVGGIWGGEDISAFFRQKIEVPREFDGEKIALHLFVGGDSLLKVNGRPFHGMDIFRSEVILSRRARAGEVMDIEIESFMNFGGSSPKENELLASELVAIDEEVRAAYWDLWCVAKALAIPDLDPNLRDYIEHNLWEAMKAIPLQEPDPARFREQVLKAQAMVRGTVYATDRFKGHGVMDLIGHSHIDVVFMWPYREFLRKIGRTHATMLRLMEEYPQFRFCQSQAKIYHDLKQHYPDLFEEIRRRVAEGRWEPMGALWVEPDCNLVSGESLVRQILHGQRFWRENFGFSSRTLWHPDVFGLPGSLPQIMARSGLAYFVSNKMVPWNDTNPWTLNTFWWEGLDGSRVLGIVPPGHFMGTVDPDVVARQWSNFADRETIGETLHVYGWGDGGGGVDPEMIESGRRYGDFPGLVPMRFAGAEESFDRIRARADGVPLPVLRDEIYLEAHRGTYTHKGRLKKLNRRAELLYREAEMLAALAWTQGHPYPDEDLDRGWKDLLTSQFHDALPGTHIPVVYGELLQDHERIAACGAAIRDGAVAALLGGGEGGMLLFNSLPAPRSGCLSVPAGPFRGRVIADPQTGRPLPQQDVADLDGTERRLVVAGPVPPVGFKALALLPGTPPVAGGAAPSAGPGVLENELLRATFDGGGELTSLWDKEHDREVLAAGQTGNRFQMFEDTPGKYDAWDIVETYSDHPVPMAGSATLAVDEQGPLRASLRLEKTFAQSRIVQRISLCAGSRQLTFETQVDWVERQRLLKVAFPVEINASWATYDIPFGNMPRPTHANTSFDRARFEVPAQQWMDLSQSDYGVSLLNDCKYGCDARGKTMRLTLLKGSIHPDPNADRETHHLTYALYPHAGEWRQAQTHREAALLNVPVLAAPVEPAAAARWDGRTLLSCSAANLSLEAVKRSEDGKHLIVRLVERHNAMTRALVRFARPVRGAWACDLMENAEAALAVEGDSVRVTCRPCEIVTLRVDVA